MINHLTRPSWRRLSNGILSLQSRTLCYAFSLQLLGLYLAHANGCASAMIRARDCNLKLANSLNLHTIDRTTALLTNNSLYFKHMQYAHPTVDFFSNRARIDPFDKTLILDKVSLSDQATYICEGENSIGSARTMATVSVNCKFHLIIENHSTATS